ncbi:MAG TPA: cobalt-precorrin-5B (C(1))-methyltransferase, partial [Methanothrix sp.]|nr:cobalt-precorrin-5B (C(1))-methyltransferase [Methanothrix sp.]
MPEKDPELIADPVSGFSIPLSWIESCSDPLAREKILSGRWTILSSGQLLKRGLTTGTTAAAAAKGAVVSLVRATESLEVMTPAGIPVSVSVKAENGYCNARKDGGDHQSDVTAGLGISARAEPSGETVLLAGAGIGRIGAGGLCDQIGRPAISPSAKGQIMMAISEGLKVTGLEHVRVEIWVPQGERISRQTLNPKLGIMGGISILGST